MELEAVDPSNDQSVLSALQDLVDSYQQGEKPGAIDARLILRLVQRIRQLEQRVSALEAKVP